MYTLDAIRAARLTPAVCEVNLVRCVSSNNHVPSREVTVALRRCLLHGSSHLTLRATAAEGRTA